MANERGQGGRPLKIPDNCFINFMVKCPCLTAVISGAICLFTVMVTMRIIRANGEDIIAESAARDVNDLRSRQYAAKEVAVRMSEIYVEGSAQECEVGRWNRMDSCDNTTYPPLTLDGQIVLMVFMAKEGSDNAFTTTSVPQIKDVVDRITGHQNHTDFCKRTDITGQSTACSEPLSVLRLFYAQPNQGSIQSAVNLLDAMDGSSDGRLDVMLTPGLSSNLSRIMGHLRPAFTASAPASGREGGRGSGGRGGGGGGGGGGPRPGASGGRLLASAKALMDGSGNNCTTGGNANQTANPQVLSCMVDAAAAAAGASQLTVNVFKVMYPVVMSFAAPSGQTMQDVPSVLKLAAYMKEVDYFAPYVDYYFDRGFSISNQKSKYSRGVIKYGAPLAGFRNKMDREDDQDKVFGDWFFSEFKEYIKDTNDLGQVEVLFFASPLIREEFLSIILTDSLKVLVSLVLVFLWIWMQTNSIFIASVGALEIVFSIPLAFFLYYTVFQFKYFDGLNFMTLFIVVAIGADDIFVFMDQYKQSAYVAEACKDLRTRMNWVYARASWAMFITSATTCAAFVCTASSPLPNIQSFGIFSAFVIIVDYILVITWFPACVVLYHNYIENRPCILCCHRCKELFPCSWNMETSTAKINERGPGDMPQKRILERGISGPLAGFIKKFAIPIVIFFLLLLIPACYLAGGIQPLSSSEEFLPADHPFQRVWTISGTQFPTSAEAPNTEVNLIWGVSDMDMSGVNLLRNGDKQEGTIVMDTTFQFDEAAQQHIWNVCEEVRLMEVNGLADFLSSSFNAEGNPEGEVDCPLFDWKNYLQRPGGEGWPLPLAQVSTVMGDFLDSPGMDQWGRAGPMKDKWKRYIGFDREAGQVKIVRISVKSRLQQRAAHAPSKLSLHYNYFEDWVDVLNAPTGRHAAPPSANKVFQVAEGQQNGPHWVWMHTQSIFRKSAIQGAIIGTVIAFVVILVATQQIIIAIGAFLTIASILASVLACMKMAGFELGSIASICITILAGFAVDYVVHLAHAFNHSKMPTRTEKVQEAFDDIGVSVLSGAVTSVLAAAVLLQTVIQFFAKFGFFLICTVIWAWVWGNFFFMSLMRLVGPDEGTHWLLRLPHSILPAWPSCCSKSANDEARLETEGEAQA